MPGQAGFLVRHHAGADGVLRRAGLAEEGTFAGQDASVQHAAASAGRGRTAGGGLDAEAPQCVEGGAALPDAQARTGNDAKPPPFAGTGLHALAHERHGCRIALLLDDARIAPADEESALLAQPGDRGDGRQQLLCGEAGREAGNAVPGHCQADSDARDGADATSGRWLRRQTSEGLAGLWHGPAALSTLRCAPTERGPVGGSSCAN